MNDKELLSIALDTVIKYAAEQGVKLRKLDFDMDDMNGMDFYWNNGKLSYKNCIKVLYSQGVPSSVMVKISYTGRWEKQLSKVKDQFLNYYNARLEANHLSFSFTINELEILSVKKNAVENPNDDKIEKVIRRINKLLALSDQSRNPSEHEAIAASLQIQKLLAQYNLSLTDVTGEQQEENVEQSIADVGVGKKWKYQLADAVAVNFACKNYFVGSEQIVFYGYKANIVSARRVFVYLFKVGDKLANQYAKKHREEWGYADGVYNSFCAGFIAGVRKELEKQCTALAIVVQPKVLESWEVFSEKFDTIDANIKSNDREAYKEGFVEGKRALNAQYLPE